MGEPNIRSCDSFRLFHYLREAAYAEGDDHRPGVVDLDDEAVEGGRLGLDRDAVRIAMEELIETHLVERVPQDLTGPDNHRRLLVTPIDDLTAATVLLAHN
jgi:hypothetical protein